MIYNAQSDISGIMSPFNYRKRLTINHSGTLTAHQVKLVINHVNTNMRTDFGDIRFNTDTGNYIPYWIETKTDDTSADVWIKVNLADGNTIIYMYYGNANLTSASDGANTFIFYNFNSINKASDPDNRLSIDVPNKTVSYNTMHELQTGTNNTYTWALLPTSLNDFAVDFEITVTGGYSAHFQDGNMYILALGNSQETTWQLDNGLVVVQNIRTHCCDKYWQLQEVSNGTYIGTASGAIEYGLSGSDGFNIKRYLTLKRYGSTLWLGAFSDASRAIHLAPPGSSSPISKSVTTVPVNYINLGSDAGHQISSSGNGGYITGNIQNVRIRKYVSTEPTVLTSAEQTISATSMSINPTESPCRVGICTVNVTVTWTNTGESVTFTPKIIVDSTTYSLSPISLPTDDTQIAFAIPGLPVGNHTICPDPN